MKNSPQPPALPGIRLQPVADRTATSRCDEGYLRVLRRSFVAHYQGVAEPSATFPYDTIERWLSDAVAAVPHYVRDGERMVILRSAIRPPIAMRTQSYVTMESPWPAGATQGELWEIPAGLVEEDERTSEGLKRCAAREIAEEIGLIVEAESVRPLGGPFFPSAGVLGEVLYLYEVEVDCSRSVPIEGDGSPLEAHAKIEHVSFATALNWCDQGLLPDVKTELALRRLARRFELQRG